jgi:NAD(P)-dependent dehydrogenase (short-subunit alcohol dehydrogenase family)
MGHERGESRIERPAAESEPLSTIRTKVRARPGKSMPLATILQLVATVSCRRGTCRTPGPARTVSFKENVMNKLSNKVALVTGGTSGIGLAAAQLFAAEGAKVLVTGSSDKGIAAARGVLGERAEILQSDAGSPKDIEALAARLRAAGTTLDLVFLNAGIAKFGTIAEAPEELFDEMFRVNVKGVWLAFKHLVPLVNKGGAIVVNSSINNQLGMPGSSIYAASKAAVRSLVRVAANEYAGAGIRVNAVSPGPVATPLYDKLGMSKEQVAGFQADLSSKIPLGRLGRPDEIAKAALFLGTDDASWMTGEEIVVDGGMTRVA